MHSRANNEICKTGRDAVGKCVCNVQCETCRYHTEEKVKEGKAIPVTDSGGP
jgi:hypothetical protein